MYIPAVNLANMEYQLYHDYGIGANPNCPSALNGYMGQYANNAAMMNYYNPSFRSGYTGQDIFTQQNDATRVSNQYAQAYGSNPQVDWSNPQFRGLSDDLNTLGDYYVKNAAPSESLFGAAVGGAAFGLVNNPRTFIHPWNTLKTTLTGNVNKAFADIGKEGTALRELYTNKKVVDGKVFKGGYELVSEAYARMNKLESLKNPKLGWFRRSLSKQPELLKQAEEIEVKLASALKAGDIEKIAKYTEEAKRIGNAFTGFIPKGLRSIGLQAPLTKARGWINKTHYQPVEEVATKAIEESSAKATLKGSLARSCGVGNGLLFAAFEFINDLFIDKKITKAFEKDDATGWKQVGQTTIKGVGSAVGWAVGEGVGAWAGAKLGALAGTAVCPGLGTAIGAVAGLVGGSIGSWLIGKYITHPIIESMGGEAGTVAEAEKLKSTAQGQVELLKLTANQAQEDKKVDPRTLQAINNIAQFYGAQGN